MENNILSSARFPNESYDDYKTRRRLIKNMVKEHRKGRVVYPTYVQKEFKKENGDKEIKTFKTNPYVKDRSINTEVVNRTTQVNSERMVGSEENKSNEGVGIEDTKD